MNMNKIDLSLREGCLSMAREVLPDLKLVNFVPAFTRFDIFDIHKGRMQIACKGIAFIQDQCHTVVAVTGCMQELSIHPKTGKKAAAVCQP